MRLTVRKVRRLEGARPVCIKITDGFDADRILDDIFYQQDRGGGSKNFPSVFSLWEESLVVIERGYFFGASFSHAYFFDTYWGDRGLFAVELAVIESVNDTPVHELKRRPAELLIIELLELNPLLEPHTYYE